MKKELCMIKIKNLSGQEILFVEANTLYNHEHQALLKYEQGKILNMQNQTLALVDHQDILSISNGGAIGFVVNKEILGINKKCLATLDGNGSNEQYALAAAGFLLLV